MLEALDLPDGPHHGLEHGPAVLCHFDPLGQHRAPGPKRRDDEVHRRERGHREVVAEEAGRTGERALGPGGPQRDGSHVPAAWAPDLPVLVHQRAVAPLVRRLNRRLECEVTHGRPAPPIGRG